MEPVAEFDRTRAELGAQLRTLRRRAGLSGDALAAQAGWSQSKISKIETGRMTAAVEDVERLAQLLGAAPDETAALIDHARSLSAQLRTWRAQQRHSLTALQNRVRDLEATTRFIRTFQPALVPGLLQTAEYARQVFLRTRMAGTLAELADAVRARLDRQAVLFDPSKQFAFLISESALRARITPEAVMPVQIDRIVTLASLANVTIGYLPATTQLDVVPLNSFVMFDNEAVLVETTSAELVLRDVRDIALYADVFERLQAAALVGPAAWSALRDLYGAPGTNTEAEQGTSHAATA